MYLDSLNKREKVEIEFQDNIKIRRFNKNGFFSLDNMIFPFNSLGKREINIFCKQKLIQQYSVTVDLIYIFSQNYGFKISTDINPVKCYNDPNFIIFSDTEVNKYQGIELSFLYKSDNYFVYNGIVNFKLNKFIVNNLEIEIIRKYVPMFNLSGFEIISGKMFFLNSENCLLELKYISPNIDLEESFIKIIHNNKIYYYYDIQNILDETLCLNDIVEQKDYEGSWCLELIINQSILCSCEFLIKPLYNIKIPKLFLEGKTESICVKAKFPYFINEENRFCKNIQTEPVKINFNSKLKTISVDDLYIEIENEKLNISNNIKIIPQVWSVFFAKANDQFMEIEFIELSDFKLVVLATTSFTLIIRNNGIEKYINIIREYSEIILQNYFSFDSEINNFIFSDGIHNKILKVYNSPKLYLKKIYRGNNKNDTCFGIFKYIGPSYSNIKFHIYIDDIKLTTIERSSKKEIEELQIELFDNYQEFLNKSLCIEVQFGDKDSFELVDMKLVEETEVPETEVPETEVQEIEVPESEVPEPEVQESEVQESEVQETEVQETKVQKTKVQKTKVQKTEMNISDFLKIKNLLALSRMTNKDRIESLSVKQIMNYGEQN